MVVVVSLTESVRSCEKPINLYREFNMRLIPINDPDNFSSDIEQIDGLIRKKFIFRVNPLEKQSICIGDNYIFCHDKEYNWNKFKRHLIQGIVEIRDYDSMTESEKTLYQLSNQKIGEVKFNIRYLDINELTPTSIIKFLVFVNSNLFEWINENYLNNKKFQDVIVYGTSFSLTNEPEPQHLWNIQSDIDQQKVFNEFEDGITINFLKTFHINFSSNVPDSKFFKTHVTEKKQFENKTNVSLIDYLSDFKEFNKTQLLLFIIVIFLLLLILIFK